MRTTTYRAPDKRRGYTAGEIAGILSKHDPEATLVVRVGWKGQPQQLTVIEDDRPLVERYPHLAEREDLVTRCETPPPPPGIHRGDQRLGEHGARGMVTFPGPINVVPSPPSPQATRDELALEGIIRATTDEDLVREELRAEGIDVAAVERAARRAQDRGLGGAR